MEKPGTFAKMHAQLLAKNNWDCIAQEILISTPRRFGKTISARSDPLCVCSRDVDDACF